jgi:hypothetical protein
MNSSRAAEAKSLRFGSDYSERPLAGWSKQDGIAAPVPANGEVALAYDGATGANPP